MPRVRKEWHLVPHDERAVSRLAGELSTSPVVAHLLSNRGIATAADGQRFLASLLGGLHSPSLLPGIAEGVDALAAAVAGKRKICIYGDYDVDGVSGTAVLFLLFQKLGATVEYYVPHRIDEGYGLNVEAVRTLAANGVEVLVTVDCGITAVEAVAEARRLGLTVVVTDHHEPNAVLPPAHAIIHPNVPGSAYPFAGLSGSGVALKFAWAICQHLSGGGRASPELRDFLLDAVGMASLGLVADVVPLLDENRILVKHGLERLAAKPPLGVRALLTAAGMEGDVIRAEDVSFRLAPRLNAAGRLGCALLVVELLTTRNPARAKELAECLEGYNAQRQTLERRIAVQARDMVEALGPLPPALVLSSPEWHAGVVGIVAGRLVEQYGRPVILVAEKDADAPSTGSGRSVPGFPLHEALHACTAELVGHGGHAMAAGVRVLPSKLAAFRAKFIDYAARHFPQGPPAPRLRLDAEVPLSALTFSLLKEINKLEPYGAENPKPRFLASGLTVEGTPRRMGLGERHMSFRVRQGGTAMRAVAFGMGDRLEELMAQGGACCLAFTPKKNEFNGYTSVELEVVDLAAGAVAELH